MTFFLVLPVQPTPNSRPNNGNNNNSNHNGGGSEDSFLFSGTKGTIIVVLMCIIILIAMITIVRKVFPFGESQHPSIRANHLYMEGENGFKNDDFDLDDVRKV